MAGGGHSTGAYNPFDAVDRLVVAFEMRAGQQFAHQPDRKHLQAEEKQNHPKNQQRAVLLEDVDVVDRFFHEEKYQNRGAAGTGQESWRSEEMERARHVTQQEADGEQIEEDSNRAREAVMRVAAGTHDIANGTSTTFAPFHAASAGMKRCSSP